MLDKLQNLLDNDRADMDCVCDAIIFYANLYRFRKRLELKQRKPTFISADEDENSVCIEFFGEKKRKLSFYFDKGRLSCIKSANAVIKDMECIEIDRFTDVVCNELFGWLEGEINA